MLLPAQIGLDPQSGALAPASGQYRKTLADLAGLFLDATAHRQMAAQDPQRPVYEVAEHRQPGGDQFFGTTTLHPGLVGEEFFMTRGHFHRRDDMGEIYHTLSGRGLLLLRSRTGVLAHLTLEPGSVAVIPPGWAHRSVNTGPAALVFFWACNPEAGNDYADIAAQGMGQRVLRQGPNGWRIV